MSDGGGLPDPADRPALRAVADLPDNVRVLRAARPPRRWLAQWPITVVLTLAAVSLGTVALNHFRRGAVLMAAALVLAFFLRLLLPERDAGMLVVRSRLVDLLTLGAFGLGLSVLAYWVPPPA